MKFEDVYGRCYRGDLSQAEASEILGMSERTFRRWRERYEAEGAAGLYDRRLGRVGAPRAGGRGCWSCSRRPGLAIPRLRKLQLASPELARTAQAGGPGRMVGMMLHQDGSSHESPDRDHGRCDIGGHSGFFVAEEGDEHVAGSAR